MTIREDGKRNAIMKADDEEKCMGYDEYIRISDLVFPFSFAEIFLNINKWGRQNWSISAFAGGREIGDHFWDPHVYAEELPGLKFELAEFTNRIVDFDNFESEAVVSLFSHVDIMESQLRFGEFNGCIIGFEWSGVADLLFSKCYDRNCEILVKGEAIVRGCSCSVENNYEEARRFVKNCCGDAFRFVEKPMEKGDAEYFFNFFPV